ncbi:hypothetical protein LIER_25452 [Lithospermum erythrorhizon]|uniref:Homeobox domain-containing protein n=1 Tax=Lithospermum erythrorhizon TaxID=34254 RepID=A0AAV3R4W3_LITER
MADKDDGLELSLSFRCADNTKDTQPLPPPLPFGLPFMQQHIPVFADAFQTANNGNEENRAFSRGIDVNLPTEAKDSDEEVMLSSPNSSASTVSGKRCEREDNEAERGISSFEDGSGEGVRKKMRLSKEQAAVLEETFKDHNSLNPKQKLALAKQLDLMPRQVEVWFQNRRARTKMKQTEIDYEHLRRYCETLKEENKKLQKEATELRALKHSPQFYMNMTPPTTLTMCPQCEHVTASTSSSTAVTSTSLALGSSCTGINRRQPVAVNNQRLVAMAPLATALPRQQGTVFPYNLPQGKRVGC